jgi:hypothetical protein
MMKQQLKFKLLIPAILLLICASCQKVININTNNASPQIVIEGNLTDIYGGQTVTITKSVPFTSTNTYPPVTGATVILSDSLGQRAQLVEQSPGVYFAAPLAGSYGMTYTLTVTTGGKVYTASSTMPSPPVTLDSLTSTANQFTNTKNTRTIIVNYQDPISVANQYKFNLYINNALTTTIFTNDDSFSNGRYVREQLFQNDEDIVPGDTAKVELQCIDKNIYQYWFALSQLQINGPGGGITPSNPPSNFNNGALGYFSAHTSDTKVIVVE